MTREATPGLSPTALLRRLSDGCVDFVVIGGIAAVAHGSAQLTQDLDICHATDETNLDRLGIVLVELDARLRGVAETVPFVPDGRTLRRAQLLTLSTALGPLDLVPSAGDGAGYPGLRGRAVRANLGGAEVRIASLGDLIAMKRAAGRTKDLLAVEELEAIARLLRDQG